MATSFQFHALSKEIFSEYFAMNTKELKEIGAYIFTADESPCYPCRVSLTDALIGESVLAISYEHNPVSSPYRSAGPIFVRAEAMDATHGQNEIPDMLNHRLLSIRGYSSVDRMIEAETVSGKDLERTLHHQFSNENVAYIHIHNAGPGCFNCAVTRA